MQCNDLISVIMPVYNAEKYIKEAVTSIIEQTYQNWELIVINDCTQDDSMRIVESIRDDRIKIYYNDENKGIAYSRNRAIALSKGEYIAIMDDDDISMPWRFERQIEYFKEHSEIDVLGGGYQIIDSNGDLIRESGITLKNPLFIRARLLFVNLFCNSEMMFRKRITDFFNITYQEDLYGMEDFRFWIECSKVTKISNIDDMILKYRKFDDNCSARMQRDHKLEREKCYATLLRFSLLKSGFILTEHELVAITNTFKENKVVCKTIEDIKFIHNVFSKMVNQARDFKMENSKEVEIECRKQLGRMIWK